MKGRRKKYFFFLQNRTDIFPFRLFFNRHFSHCQNMNIEIQQLFRVFNCYDYYWITDSISWTFLKSRKKLITTRFSYPVFEYGVDTFADVLAFFVPDQQVDVLDVRTRSAELFDEHLSHEPGAAGHEYRGVPEEFLDVRSRHFVAFLQRQRVVEALFADQFQRVQREIVVDDILHDFVVRLFRFPQLVLSMQVQRHFERRSLRTEIFVSRYVYLGYG